MVNGAGMQHVNLPGGTLKTGKTIQAGTKKPLPGAALREGMPAWNRLGIMSIHNA